MRYVVAILMAFGASVASASAPQGDELLLMRDGNPVAKMTQVGQKVVLRGTSCILRPSDPKPPTLTPPPEFHVDPPQEEPEVEEPVEETKDVDLVSVLFYVVTAGLGWYIGRNQADDDENDNSLIDGAQRRALDGLVPAYENKETK